jgi:hypothetical protein
MYARHWARFWLGGFGVTLDPKESVWGYVHTLLGTKVCSPVWS